MYSLVGTVTTLSFNYLLMCPFLPAECELLEGSESVLLVSVTLRRGHRFSINVGGWGESCTMSLYRLFSDKGNFVKDCSPLLKPTV